MKEVDDHTKIPRGRMEGEMKVMYWDRGLLRWIVTTQEEVSRIQAEPGNISVGEVVPLGTQGELWADHAHKILGFNAQELLLLVRGFLVRENTIGELRRFVKNPQ